MLPYNELLGEVKQQPLAEQLALLEELARLLRSTLVVPSNVNSKLTLVSVSPTTDEKQARG